MEEKMLAKAIQPTDKQNQFNFKFDNSRPMGDSAANSMSHALQRQQNTIYLQAGEKGKNGCNLADLWEQICE